MKMVIDGSLAGVYRGDCECGFSWHGVAERMSDYSHSPALPIAEAAVHWRMCHEHLELQLRFTQRFHKWLESYWQRVDALNGLGQASMAR